MNGVLGYRSPYYRSCNKCDYFVHCSLSYIDRDTAGFKTVTEFLVFRYKRIFKFVRLFRRIED